AASRERGGDGVSQPAACAGDERGLALEVHSVLAVTLFRIPHVGGGGSFMSLVTGCSFSSWSATSTAFSSCGSWPAATSLGQFSTSTSGATPSFSTAQWPSAAKKPPRGAIIEPPSKNTGVSAVGTSPRHLRLPHPAPRAVGLDLYCGETPRE